MLFSRNRHYPWLAACLVSAIAASCTPNLTHWRSPSNWDQADLTLEVERQNQPGIFALSGTTALPTGTELNVIAIRRLHLQQSPLIATKPQPTYSILNYDTVVVENGRWQTTLKVWQVAPDGQYQEAWQLQAPKLKLAATPDDEVFFFVTLTPLDNLAAIEQQLAANNQRFAREYIQTTTEGDRYLQTGQVMRVRLPTGKTDAVATRPEDINGGWGNRFLPLPDLPNERQLEFPDQRQTNAPVMPEEFLY